MTFLLASLSFAVFFVGLAAPLWTGHGMDCRREIPEPPSAGEPFRYTLVARSRRRGVARRVRVLDALAGSPDAGQLLSDLPPRGVARSSCLGAPMRRGAYPMPALSWRSGFPFGVAERGGRRAAGGEFLVYPARGRLSRAAGFAAKAASVAAGAPSPTGMPGEDFRSLREYQPGDNPKRIHWRTSARLGKLQVREVEREHAAPVLVLLDSRIPAGMGAAERKEAEAGLELAVSFAAEVCRMALWEGDAVRIIGFFPQPECISAAADSRSRGLALPARLRPLLEALARLKPSDAETADALLPLAEPAGLRSARCVMAVSPTRATARTLREALPAGVVRIHAASDPGFSGIFRLLNSLETGTA